MSHCSLHLPYTNQFLDNLKEKNCIKNIENSIKKTKYDNMHFILFWLICSIFKLKACNDASFHGCVHINKNHTHPLMWFFILKYSHNIFGIFHLKVEIYIFQQDVTIYYHVNNCLKNLPQNLPCLNNFPKNMNLNNVK